MPTPLPAEPGSNGGSGALAGERGLAGRVALSWSVAGGVAAGGFLLILSTAMGSGSGAGIPITSTALFAVGAVAGFVHGAILGLASRPPGVSHASSVRGLEWAALWAIPALLVAWVATLWLAMTTVALTTGRFSILLGAAIGWIFGLGALAWAAVEGRSALGHALRRWPERRAGSVLVSLTFATLLVAFVATRPEIWWTDLQVSGFGAVLLALGATFWIVIPVVIVVLHFLHQWLADSPIWDS
jgi:hypothetical protein